LFAATIAESSGTGSSWRISASPTSAARCASGQPARRPLAGEPCEVNGDDAAARRHACGAGGVDLERSEIAH
jgi:hypothetical protein